MTEASSSEIILTKTEVEYLLQTPENESDFAFISNENCKSDAWERFYSIYYKGSKQDFVKCKTCQAILSYKCKTGTASLLRHRCVLQTSDKQAKSDTVAKKIVPEKRKRQVALKQLYFISKDLCRIDCTERNGFRKLAQCLIDLGADYGRQNVNDVLSDKETLTQTVMPCKINEIKTNIRNLLERNDLALTVDLCEGDSVQGSFLSVTGHIITEEYDFRSFFFGTKEISEPEKEENIRQIVTEILNDFVPQAAKRLIKCTIVVDENSSNLTNAFRYYSTNICFLSILNPVIQNFFYNILAETSKNANTEKVLLEDSSLHEKFAKHLKHYTQWESNHSILESAAKEFEDIGKIFFKGKKTDLPSCSQVSDISVEDIRSFLDFLELFQECSENLSSDSETTIHDVCLWNKKLQMHIEANIGDSAALMTLKTNLLDLLKRQLKVNRFHNVALFLNPNFKSLKFLSSQGKKCVYAQVKQWIDEANSKDDSAEEDPSSATGESSSATRESSPPTKKFKGEFYFKELMDFTDPEAGSDAHHESTEEEIKRYIDLKLKSPCKDILNFWKNDSRYPNIRKLVRRILNTPATSKSSQTISSLIENTLKECGTTLSSDNLSSLIFLKMNFDLKF